MKAIILAGGHGTRLMPLTYTKPKPMLPLLDKPVLQHIVERLATQDFDEIIVTTNYLREQVIDHFKEGESFGVKMVYPIENRPLGTAGSVKNAEEYLNETFAVVQGDGISDIDLREVVAQHKEKGSLATIVLTAMKNPSEYGVVELGSGSEVVRFKEKPKPEDCFSNLVNTGIYVLEPEVLKYIPAKTEFDFARDLFPSMLALGKSIHGYKSSSFWVDIGRPDKYMEAIRWLFEKRFSGQSLGFNSGAEKSIEVDADARIGNQVLLKEGCRVGKGVVIEGFSVIDKNVEIDDGTKIVDSVIYQGSDIGRCSHVGHSIVAEECRIGDNVEIEESVVGAGCKIGNNTVLHAGSRIWPRLEVKAFSALRGIVEYPPVS